MYYPALGSDDERLQVNGWTYYVRAVKWRDEFTQSAVSRSGSELFDFLVETARDLLFARRRPWIVGVVRQGDVATWNDITPKLVHSEILSERIEPRVRIHELVTEVHEGRFAPL